MFGKKKASPIELTKLSSLIANNVKVCGDIHFQDGLRVDGQVKGNTISNSGAKSLLVLSDQGEIVGDVSVYDAIINGSIVGNVEVTHFLELQAGARVTGDILYHQLKMDCGASVSGRLTKAGEAEDTTNVVELPSATAASK